MRREQVAPLQSKPDSISMTKTPSPAGNLRAATMIPMQVQPKYHPSDESRRCSSSKIEQAGDGCAFQNHQGNRGYPASGSESAFRTTSRSQHSKLQELRNVHQTTACLRSTSAAASQTEVQVSGRYGEGKEAGTEPWTGLRRPRPAGITGLPAAAAGAGKRRAAGRRAARPRPGGARESPGPRW